MKKRGQKQVETHQSDPVTELAGQYREFKNRVSEILRKIERISGGIRAAEYAAKLARYSQDTEREAGHAAIAAELRERRAQLCDELRSECNSLA